MPKHNEFGHDAKERGPIAPVRGNVRDFDPGKKPTPLWQARLKHSNLSQALGS
jgi:hypothetical protein